VDVAASIQQLSELFNQLNVLVIEQVCVFLFLVLLLLLLLLGF